MLLVTLSPKAFFPGNPSLQSSNQSSSPSKCQAAQSYPKPLLINPAVLAISRTKTMVKFEAIKHHERVREPVCDRLKRPTRSRMPKPTLPSLPKGSSDAVLARRGSRFWPCHKTRESLLDVRDLLRFRHQSICCTPTHIAGRKLAPIQRICAV